MRRSAFETIMMAKKPEKIKTFVEEGVKGLTEVVVGGTFTEVAFFLVTLKRFVSALTLVPTS